MSAYAETLAAAVVRRDGPATAKLLRLDESAHPGGWAFVQQSVLAKMRERKSADDFARASEAEAQAVGLGEFSALCGLHLATVGSLAAAHECDAGPARREKLDTAFRLHSQAFKKFLELFRKDGSSWLVETMMTLIHDTRSLAVWADSETSETHTEHLRETKSLLETCFRQTTMGRAMTDDAQRKRMVGLYIVNHQFKVFFALKSLQLCRNLVRSVEMPTFPNLEDFPLNQQVMYEYYRGRLLILDDRVTDARRALQFALDNCPPQCRRNRRLILEYLVPISLFCGRAPSQKLLDEYQIGYLSDLMRHVRNGNVRALSALIDDQQDHFIARGLFLALDQLKVIAYRNLFRNVVALYQAQAEERQKTRVPLDLFLRPFELYREPDPLAQLTDAGSADAGGDAKSELMEHVKCVLSNLIYERFVKGYMSHEKEMLVLSPKEPFPKLSVVNPIEG
ncbi:PCI domain-containing protein 2-like [Hondaea fermentalgiana]|uniref:PCI domain-containing protein 2-like n=1 Tax=Hondaea fermentalgiana TaxID=2315210 RepID=A0A2R5GQJ1_9STRA|nr:PCI domain-containing protein 2-like [Hondaea fermentalgiana]|eukprot:GBG33137.1 PCI domain-containing protein 2-like [Hondaea fermentalgiana]